MGLDCSLRDRIFVISLVDSNMQQRLRITILEVREVGYNPGIELLV